jgi:predicted nucleic acid-binding protein
VSGCLLDANVVSEARKGRAADSSFLSWYQTLDEGELFLSVLVTGEIRKGIELARRQDLPKAQALERWLRGLERQFADRILPVTPAIADQWGRLSAVRPLPVIDALLAATALIHDLTFVTRNVAQVHQTGVKLLNPFTIPKR